MEQLRVAMGFLLAGAAVWLFYVLAAQMSRERLAFIELSILALALFIWTRHRATSGTAAKYLGLFGMIICVALVVALAAGAGNSATTNGSLQSPRRLIEWSDFDRREAESLAAEGRLVFVDVTADWCFTCKVNERLVLETPEVAAAFGRYGVIPMKADWTNRSDTITRFLADHGRYGIPFYLLYRPGDEPYVFPELLTRDGLLRVVEAAAASPVAARPTTQ
jgi:suppressor for copper-sensitivity B